jgi:ABC-type glycerol-3-phosphate transport system substrate-binding protein
MLKGAAATLPGAALAACGGPSPTLSPETTFDAKQKYKISFWHWGTEEYFYRERAAADMFVERHPNVDVEVVPDRSGNFQERMQTLFAAGTPPDVHLLDMQVTQEWGKKNVLVDLNQYLKRDKSLGLAFYEQVPMAKQALEVMSYKGQVLGLPDGAAPNPYFYNADLFHAAGLRTPHDLWREDRWTWDAMADALTKIAKRSERGWSVVGAATGLHRLWMNAAGGREFDDVKAPKTCLYDQPASVAALQFLQDLRHVHRVTPVDFVRETGTSDTEGFRKGKLAMMARWTSGVGLFKYIESFKWGIVPYPKMKSYANDFATSGLAIAAESGSRAAAWEWIKFRTSAEGSVAQAGDGTQVYFAPEARKAAISTHRAISTLETPTAMVDILEGGKYSFVRLLSKDQAKIHNNLLNPEISQILLNQETPVAGAKRSAAAVNDFLKASPQ